MLHTYGRVLQKQVRHFPAVVYSLWKGRFRGQAVLYRYNNALAFHCEDLTGVIEAFHRASDTMPTCDSGEVASDNSESEASLHCGGSGGSYN